MKRNLSKNEFYRIVDNYRPSKFEVMGDRSWAKFKRPMNYLVRNRYRFFRVFRYMFEYFNLEKAELLDLGPSPGTFLRLLRQISPSDNLNLYGAGLRVSEEFINMMKDVCNTKIFEVHLDPENPDLFVRQFSSDIPLGDQSIDYIYAGEIIEHFVNPEWMLKESFRVLKPGGQIIITSPNISRIGNVFKLLVGRSNLERLSPIGSQDPNDEHRGHFHEYCMKELQDELRKTGFKVVKKEYYLGRVTEMVIMNSFKKAVEMVKKPFYVFPHLRDDIFIVAQKPL